MFNKIVSVVLIIAFISMMAGCSAHTHIVGDGAQTGRVVEERQWYVIWGLVPINEVNTDEMAGDAANYTIETQMNVLDVLIYVVLGWLSVTSRTVTVTR